MSVVVAADAALGAIAICAIALAPVLHSRLQVGPAAGWGVPLVLALPLIVIAGPRFGGGRAVNQALFVTAVVAFVVGSAIIVGGNSDDGPDGPPNDGDPGSDPPWWPGFERDFRQYARRQRVPA